MTNKELAHYSMGLKTESTLNKDIKIWKADKIMGTYVLELQTVLTEIKVTNIKQKTPIKGITLEKSMYRNKLNTSTEIILNIICSYASSIGNAELYQQFDIPDSSVKRIKDAQFPMLVLDITNYITINKDVLKPFGLTDELIKKYQAETVNYNNYLIKPTQAKGEIAEATQKIKSLIKKMMEILTTKLDKAMKQYSETYPDFYGDYVESRYIYDLPTHHLSLKGTIVDADTGLPLYFAKVTVKKYKAGTETASKVKSTSKKGNYEFKALEVGLWTVIVENTFYEPFIIEIDILPGTMYKLDIKLKKIKT